MFGLRGFSLFVASHPAAATARAARPIKRVIAITVLVMVFQGAAAGECSGGQLFADLPGDRVSADRGSLIRVAFALSNPHSQPAESLP
jgi:hypothetical protein